MRLPITPQLSTKDGVSAKNARLTNCLKESKKSGDKAVVRPGLVLQAEGTGVGGGLVAFNNELVSVYGTTLGFGVVPENSYAFTETTFPTSVNWGVVAYGGGTYVAVKTQSDEVATSSDGLIWSPSTMPISAFWNACAYGGGTFCMVADGNGTTDPDAATSSDGVTWDYQSMPFVANFVSIAWNGTVFCAVAADASDVTISADGVTWNSYTSTNTGNYQVASNGSRFVAVGIGGATVSTDNGETWSAHVISATYPNWSGIAYMNGIFVATRGGFATGIYYATSSDGVSWTLGNFPSSRYWSIAASNSLFLAWSYLDTLFLLSDDAIVWEAHTAPWASGISSASSDGFDFSVGAYPTSDEAAVISASFSPGSIPALTTIPTGLYDFAQSPL